MLLYWDHHNSISRLDIFGKKPGYKSVWGLVYVFSAPHPGCVFPLLWGCGSQRSHLWQARGFLFFFSSPVWTLRPQLPLQDPFLPSKQMFSGHLSSFVGWACPWILVFSQILIQHFLSTLSSLLFSRRCFSSFFLAHLLFTILSRETGLNYLVHPDQEFTWRMSDCDLAMSERATAALFMAGDFTAFLGLFSSQRALRWPGTQLS